MTRSGPLTWDDLWEALEKSVTLQSHYAGLLNMHDGGQRLQFSSAESWLARLMEIDHANAENLERANKKGGGA